MAPFLGFIKHVNIRGFFGGFFCVYKFNIWLDVFQICDVVQELKVRYFAERVWTGLDVDVEQLISEDDWTRYPLTSNPVRVRTLLMKLGTLRAQAQKLNKNVAFRPNPSQVRTRTVVFKRRCLLRQVLFCR